MIQYGEEPRPLRKLLLIVGPLLLVLIRIENTRSDPLLIELTETWGVERTAK